MGDMWWVWAGGEELRRFAAGRCAPPWNARTRAVRLPSVYVGSGEASVKFKARRHVAAHDAGAEGALPPGAGSAAAGRTVVMVRQRGSRACSRRHGRGRFCR